VLLRVVLARRTPSLGGGEDESLGPTAIPRGGVSPQVLSSASALRSTIILRRPARPPPSADDGAGIGPSRPASPVNCEGDRPSLPSGSGRIGSAARKEGLHTTVVSHMTASKRRNLSTAIGATAPEARMADAAATRESARAPPARRTISRLDLRIQRPELACALAKRRLQLFRRAH
jgi:hypothetical protein